MSTKTEEQNKKLAFKMWLEIAYLDWQAENKKRATLDEFADYIGYSRPLISMWLGGKRLPSEEGVRRLAELFGNDIYLLLGLDPNLQSINSRWENMGIIYFANAILNSQNNKNRNLLFFGLLFLLCL